MTLTDNQRSGTEKKMLAKLKPKMIMFSLPAAASNSDCRRSHPDCRATDGEAPLNQAVRGAANRSGYRLCPVHKRAREFVLQVVEIGHRCDSLWTSQAAA